MPRTTAKKQEEQQLVVEISSTLRNLNQFTIWEHCHNMISLPIKKWRNWQRSWGKMEDSIRDYVNQVSHFHASLTLSGQMIINKIASQRKNFWNPLVESQLIIPNYNPLRTQHMKNAINTVWENWEWSIYWLWKKPRQININKFLRTGKGSRK